jgi:hypothetical protein
VAFLDQRIPRYERDIINMVGMGVTENAALKPNVKESAVGFSVDSAASHGESFEEPVSNSLPVSGSKNALLSTPVRFTMQPC